MIISLFLENESVFSAQVCSSMPKNWANSYRVNFNLLYYFFEWPVASVQLFVRSSKISLNYANNSCNFFPARTLVSDSIWTMKNVRLVVNGRQVYTSISILLPSHSFVSSMFSSGVQQDIYIGCSLTSTAGVEVLRLFSSNSLISF